jgi:hypothetical protein
MYSGRNQSLRGEAVRTITERLAKRIRKGQDIPMQSVQNETLLCWAKQYAETRRLNSDRFPSSGDPWRKQVTDLTTT